CGCFRWEIPLESIQRVALRRHSKRTALLGYGAALSLDAIRIRWEREGLRREILISPVEQDDFLADLLLIAPWIEVERDGD
ncbi:MAG: PH domain-containing protein, partial [Planctomycetaceae bacterium]|nr:PH domain-containing protein [Planctomycetaceae bacterium]